MSVRIIHHILLVILLGYLASCKSTPQEQSREQGHKITRLLIQDLKQVKNRDDLLLVAPALEHHFKLLGEEMLKARRHAHLAASELSQEDHLLSEELGEQINRVSQIEGGRQVISASQKSIRDLLDEKSLF